ncbi:MAG: nicotinate-nucleotide--dimethylbenzimidazole phosphoribosyltransferase, partial [Spirochaetaceae bacterium]
RDERLLEFDYGSWEGVPWEHIPGDALRQWSDRWTEARAGDGERLPEMIARVRALCHELAADWENQMDRSEAAPSTDVSHAPAARSSGVLLVTHAGVIRCLFHLLHYQPLHQIFAPEVGYGELVSFDLSAFRERIRWERAMQDRLDGRTKPAGSLGRLERVAAHIATITRSASPRLTRKLVIVTAADHGVSRLSLYPRAVTAQMAANILAGGAAISVLARRAGADVWLVDAGIDWACGLFASFDAMQTAIPRDPTVTRCISASCGPGTGDWASGTPAMTDAQYRTGLEAGQAILREARAAGYDCIAFGDMGIGNTSAAAAVAMALGLDEAVIDRGTGINDAQLAEKRRVIREAVARHAPCPNPADAMTRFGGFELLLMTGMMTALPENPCVALLDGFPVTAAALAAVRLNPAVADFLIAGHQSAVRGHELLLQSLGLEPVLDLGMHLGEGSGAVLAMPVLDTALALAAEMAGFADAQVDTAATEETRY